MPRDRPRLTVAATGAFLVALTVTAHFALARRFGLYEDDYAFAGATLNWNLARMWGWVKLAFGRDGQGRPVGFLLGAFLPWLGYRATGDLTGMYAVAAVVASANVVLFYALLRRAAFPRPVPLLAAMAFALFPADTTQPFLCHALILQPSLTFLLIALHLYLGGRRPRPWSYLAIACALLSYETAFLPFLAAPLLVPGVWNRRLPGRLLRHAGVLVAMLTVAFAVRWMAGERRVGTAVSPDVFRKIGLGCVIGPAVSLKQCAVRPIDAYWPAAALAAVPLATVVMMAGRRAAALSGGQAARLVGCGVALSVLAYGLSFTHYPPTATYGRLTSVHVAAAPGIALLVAAGTCSLLALGRRLHLFYPTAALVGAYLATLFGFAWWVQLGFARQWREEQSYWAQVLHLCPDAGADTVVLLRGRLPEHSDFALAQSWADYRVWGELFEFPKVSPPRLVDFGDWPDHLEWRDGALRWSRIERPPGYGLTDGEPLPAGNLILLEVSPDGVLTRASGTLAIGAHPIPLKPPPGLGDGPAYARRPLYRLLIGH
jgi:hypothetical protein